jgi:segregation and condensation protein B
MEEQNLNPEPASPEAEQASPTPAEHVSVTDTASEGGSPAADAVEADAAGDGGALETTPETPETPGAVGDEPPECEPGQPVETDRVEADTAAPVEPNSSTEAVTGSEPESPSGAVSMEELLGENPREQEQVEEKPQVEDSQLRAVLEAIVYVAEEPLTLTQISAALNEPTERIRWLLTQLIEEFDKPEHGLAIREVAGGFKMTTKPEHHEAVRDFVKSLKPPLKLSLPALETLAVIECKCAYFIEY